MERRNPCGAELCGAEHHQKRETKAAVATLAENKVAVIICFLQRRPHRNEGRAERMENDEQAEIYLQPVRTASGGGRRTEDNFLLLFCVFCVIIVLEIALIFYPYHDITKKVAGVLRTRPTTNNKEIVAPVSYRISIA